MGLVCWNPNIGAQSHMCSLVPSLPSTNIGISNSYTMVEIGGEEIIFADAIDYFGLNVLEYTFGAGNPTAEVIDLAMGYDPGTKAWKTPEARDNARKLLTNISDHRIPIEILLRDLNFSTVPLDVVIHVLDI